MTDLLINKKDNYSMVNAVADLGRGPLLVHSDSFHTMKEIPRGLKGNEALDAHIQNLKLISGGRGLWLPSFDEDFPRRPFNMRTSRGRVGEIAERYRTHWAEWRTPVPLISFVGEGRPPDLTITDPYDPYGNGSAFADLIKRDGIILFYGASFSTLTMIHHIEVLNGRPLYRYDKILKNHLIGEKGQKVSFNLLYHCRPSLKPFEYDFEKLQRTLLTRGLILPSSSNSSVFAINARALCDVWKTLLLDDPLVFLKTESRFWIEPLLKRLRRRFIASDIEK